MKSNLPDHDLVKVYLNQMSRISPISVKEERILAAELEETRSVLRDRILLGGLPLARCVELLEAVQRRQLPIDRVFLVDLNIPGAKRDVYEALDAALPALKRLLKVAHRDFTRYLEDGGGEGGHKIRKAVRVRLEEALRLTQPFNLHITRLYPIFEDAQRALRRIKSAGRRVKSLEQRKAPAAEIEEAKRELLQIQIDAVATPKTLRRYAEAVKEALVAYEDAKRKLSRKNLRLVVSIAKKFRSKGLPFLDLIQEGNTGLMKALDRYQASRGNKFSTYATWWIKQTITRSIAYQSRTVRIPIHAINNLNRLIEERELFVQREGREPSLAEISDIAHMPEREVNRLFELNRTSLSLDQPYGGDEEGQFGEVLEDHRVTEPVELTQKNLLKEQVAQLLKELSYREREVLRMRYGLDGGSTYTLEEVGQVFNVSRERIRQIEVGALQKLQLPLRREKLKTYWEEIA